MKQKTKKAVGLSILLVVSLLCSTAGWAASTEKKAPSTKRKVVRTREDMILEVEMKALREAMSTKQDQEDMAKFAERAQKETESAKQSADQAREMVQNANSAMSEVTSAKASAQAAVEKAKAAAEEARTLADQAKKDAKLAGVDVTTYTELRKNATKEVLNTEGRENAALAVLKQARDQEQYYRNLIKRRMRNAEDFYYIAEAAMKKGGNAQAMEFAVKAKAEMEQAKVAENEAAIRAEATSAAEKVLEARKQATESAKTKALALAKLLRLSEEIAKALDEAAAAAKLTAAAAQQVLAKTEDFTSAKDEIVTFTDKKVQNLTSIKDAAEKKEIMAQQAAESAQAVVAAKQKALAEAETRARTVLADARGLVLGSEQPVPATEPVPAGR